MTTEEKNPIQVTFKIQIDGFGADVTAECFIEHVPGIVKKMREHGIEPANSPYVWTGQPQDRGQAQGQPHSAPSDHKGPLCPVHNRPMSPSKFPNGGWYCTAKHPDGSYCSETIKGEAA